MQWLSKYWTLRHSKTAGTDNMLQIIASEPWLSEPQTCGKTSKVVNMRQFINSFNFNVNQFTAKRIVISTPHSYQWHNLVNMWFIYTRISGPNHKIMIH